MENTVKCWNEGTVTEVFFAAWFFNGRILSPKSLTDGNPNSAWILPVMKSLPGKADIAPLGG